MFAVYLWISTAVVAFAAGFAAGVSLPRRNRYTSRIPGPAHNVIRFQTKARGRVA